MSTFFLLLPHPFLKTTVTMSNDEFATSTPASATSKAPVAPLAPVSRETRPSIVGGDEPEHPYPMELFGSVTKGFGRGARFLGIPTGK